MGYWTCGFHVNACATVVLLFFAFIEMMLAILCEAGSNTRLKSGRLIAISAKFRRRNDFIRRNGLRPRLLCTTTYDRQHSFFENLMESSRSHIEKDSLLSEVACANVLSVEVLSSMVNEAISKRDISSLEMLFDQCLATGKGASNVADKIIRFYLVKDGKESATAVETAFKLIKRSESASLRLTDELCQHVLSSLV